MVDSSQQTRDRILQASFDEIYVNGYQGMRIDAILKRTGLAKGALYHHFPNKKSLGYAVVDECFAEHFLHRVNDFDIETDPIEGFCALMQDLCDNITDEEVNLGCPIHNLSQEMTGLDEGFKERLSKLYEAKAEMITTALAKGQEKGTVRKDIDPVAVAGFCISSYQGIVGAAKCMQSRDTFISFTSVLMDYLRTLSTKA